MLGRSRGKGLRFHPHPEGWGLPASSFAILQVKPNEIILLAAGSYKEGTRTFLASDIPQIVEDMENGMSADEAVPHYARPMDLVEMISEFMGSGFEPRYG